MKPGFGGAQALISSPSICGEPAGGCGKQVLGFRFTLRLAIQNPHELRQYNVHNNLE